MFVLIRKRTLIACIQTCVGVHICACAYMRARVYGLTLTLVIQP